MPSFVRYLTPLVLFLALAALLYKGLALNPREVPSPLIGKPAPEFTLPELKDTSRQLSHTDFQGKVSLLNVWATWCVSCRAEHPLLMQLARQGVTIYGLDYKDSREDAQRWLQRFGDPYVANAFDADGRVGIDWGVYGTPETFVIDQQGIIRHKHIGPLTEEAIQREILPLIQQLKGDKG
ncbi:MAG: DsbE family thiol:disulfide interchange protein [Gammaproteobacteria bacterium]|nr:MAG: DsbE family thiol:disulfide interchange protein [Gammaproteobacteria bacterium]